MRQWLAARGRAEGAGNDVGVRRLAAAGAVVRRGSDGHRAERLAGGRPVIDQDDVATGDADVIAAVARGRRHPRRETEREGQGVLGAPLDLHHGLAVPLAVGVIQRIDGPGDLRQPHRLPMTRIRVGGSAGGWSEHLLEDQHVADAEVQCPLRAGRPVARARRGGGPRCRYPRILERRGRRADGQAAGAVAPGMEKDLAVGLAQLDRDAAIAHQRLEDVIARRRNPFQLRRPRDVVIGPPRERGREGDRARVECVVVIGRDRHPGAGIRSLMHPVADQAGVAAHGDAEAGGAQVGLGGDGILVVAEPVADVGEQLEEHDADVRHVPLLPLRHRQGETVQEELPEAGVVLGEIVDVGGRLRPGRADGRRLAVEIGGAAGLEREGDRGELRIEAVHRRVGLTPLLVERDQAQHVLRGVARARDLDLEGVVQRRVLLPMHADVEHLHVANAPAAADPYVGRRQVARGAAQEDDLEPALVVAGHLDEIEAEERRPPHVLPAALVAAGQSGVAGRIHRLHAIWRTNVSVRPSCVSRTT